MKCRVEIETRAHLEAQARAEEDCGICLACGASKHLIEFGRDQICKECESEGQCLGILVYADRVNVEDTK